jgi:hypothetical protein
VGAKSFSEWIVSRGWLRGHNDTPFRWPTPRLFPFLLKRIGARIALKRNQMSKSNSNDFGADTVNVGVENGISGLGADLCEHGKNYGHGFGCKKIVLQIQL